MLTIGITEDLVRANGDLVYPTMSLEGLGKLDYKLRVVGTGTSEVKSADLKGADGVLVFGPSVTAGSLQEVDRLLVVARLGVGLDNVDVAACTRAGVLVTITPDAVRRPMASAVVSFLLGLVHGLPIRDRLTRMGAWERAALHTGMGLSGRTLGLLGYGNIGRDVRRLLQPFEMNVLAHDPFLDAQIARADDLRLASLDELLARSDVVCVLCPLTSDTYHLLDSSRLAAMKPSAFLINVSRGGIIDQRALTRALEEGAIAGAALDVFEEEPIPADDPLLQLDNVILASHSIGFTDELLEGLAYSACEAVVDVFSGRVPTFVANRPVLRHPRLQYRFGQEDATDDAGG